MLASIMSHPHSSTYATAEAFLLFILLISLSSYSFSFFLQMKSIVARKKRVLFS